MKTLREQVYALWERYWENFAHVERLRRAGEPELSALQVRREFAEDYVSQFHRLEQDLANNEIDETWLLLLQIGYSLHGDMGDEKRALKYLRSMLISTPSDHSLLIEQIHAVELTLHAYDCDQEELANTLALIDTSNLSAKEFKELQQSILTLIKNYFDQSTLISDRLRIELRQVCNLGPDNKEQLTVGGLLTFHGVSS